MRCTAALGLLLFGLAAAQTPQDASFLNGNLYGLGDIPAGQADAPYWWMNKGSPFKRSYEAAQPQQQQQQSSYNSNPFLNGNYAAAASQESLQLASYMAPGYLPPTQNVPPTISCTARGQVCVAKYLCRNGFVDRDVTDGSKQTCNADNEVCCTIRAAPVTQPPRPQGIPCQDKNYGCVSPSQCYNGVVSTLNGFSSKPQGQNCFAPEVCCRFSDLSGSPNELSEHTVYTTQRTVPTAAEVLTSEGYVITVPETKFTQRPEYTVPTQSPNTYVPPLEPNNSNDHPVYSSKPTPSPTAPPTYNTYRPTPPPSRGETVKSQPIPRPTQRPTQRPIEGSPSNNRPNVLRPNNDAPPPAPPTQCPAATNCTEIQFCSANGIISKTPVILSPDQEVYRVPLSDCRNVEFGFVGKCCRDPDYTDPWPVGILGQYNASILGFDDGSYKPAPGGQVNTVVKGPQRPINNFGQPQQQQPQQPQQQFNPFGQQPQPSSSNTVAIRGQGILSQPIAVASPSNTQYSRTQFPQQHPNQIPQQRERDSPNAIRPITSGPATCAVRDAQNSFPKGAGPYDAAFGEFPWQAMILKESTKSLLCGGAIIQANTVLTSANCVQGQKPFDVLVKGGEWKLGSDEEPKPFQTVRVKSISFHPEYQSFGRDVALLHLEIDLKFDMHIAPICFDEQDAVPVSGNDQCVCTGWGKDALKYHAAQALMHQIPIAPLDQNECAALVPGFNGQSAVCGRPQVDACQIDVGSALACDRGNGQYLLKGIYSTENQCNSPAQIVTFAKMDVKWIRDTIAAPSTNVQRQVPQPSVPQHQQQHQPQYGQQLLNQPQQPHPQQQQQLQPSQVYNQAVPVGQGPSYLPPRN